jgi:hypothetical protein
MHKVKFIEAGTGHRPNPLIGGGGGEDEKRKKKRRVRTEHDGKISTWKT